ncbi:MAG TPA: fumarate hydratase, partial [bacterium]|nr:fumarate hydratase [bacterium]
MKEISLLEVTDKVADLLVSINQRLPARVERLLSRARNQETVVLARHYLEVILKNLKVSRRLHLPLCQDTGMVTVLAECGQEIRFRADPAGSLTGAINEGVAIATRQGYLRSSVVEPLSHINTGNNTPAVVHFSLVPGDRLK